MAAEVDAHSDDAHRCRRLADLGGLDEDLSHEQVERAGASRRPRACRPVVRAPRARAALPSETGDTSRRRGATSSAAESTPRTATKPCWAQATAWLSVRRWAGSVRSMRSPLNPRAMPSADRDGRARSSGACRRDRALSVAESTSHTAAKPCCERATAWSARRSTTRWSALLPKGERG